MRLSLNYLWHFIYCYAFRALPHIQYMHLQQLHPIARKPFSDTISHLFKKKAIVRNKLVVVVDPTNVFCIVYTNFWFPNSFISWKLYGELYHMIFIHFAYCRKVSFPTSHVSNKPKLCLHFYGLLRLRHSIFC